MSPFHTHAGILSISCTCNTALLTHESNGHVICKQQSFSALHHPPALMFFLAYLFLLFSGTWGGGEELGVDVSFKNEPYFQHFDELCVFAFIIPLHKDASLTNTVSNTNLWV